MWIFEFSNLSGLFPELRGNSFIESILPEVINGNESESPVETDEDDVVYEGFSENNAVVGALDQNVTSVLSVKTTQNEQSPKPVIIPHLYRIGDADLTKEEVVQLIESLERRLVFRYGIVEAQIDKTDLELLNQPIKRKDLDPQLLHEEAQRKFDVKQEENKLELLRNELKKARLKNHKNHKV
jgi:hypothetical protein